MEGRNAVIILNVYLYIHICEIYYTIYVCYECLLYVCDYIRNRSDHVRGGGMEEENAGGNGWNWEFLGEAIWKPCVVDYSWNR